MLALLFLLIPIPILIAIIIVLIPIMILLRCFGPSAPSSEVEECFDEEEYITCRFSARAWRVCSREDYTTR